MERRVCQLVYATRVEVIRSPRGPSAPSEGLTELPSCPVCLEKLVRRERERERERGRERE